MNKIAVAVLLSAVVVTPADAADDGFYAGVTAGQSRINAPANTVLSKSTDTIVGVLLGTQVDKYWGIEMFYTGLGQFTGTNVAGTTMGTGKGHVWAIDMVGTLPLSDMLALYGKVGAASVKTSASGYVIGTGAPTTLSGASRTGVTYGVGGEYFVTPSFAVRLGWDRYAAAVTGASFAGSKDNFNVKAWTLGAVISF